MAPISTLQKKKIKKEKSTVNNMLSKNKNLLSTLNYKLYVVHNTNNTWKVLQIEFSLLVIPVLK